jgi:transaldolase
MSEHDDAARHTLNFDDAVVALGGSTEFPAQLSLESAPLLAALRRAGASHVYADTASREALLEVAVGPGGAARQEIDGNTINQPLLAKVLPAALEDTEPEKWVKALRGHDPELSDVRLMAALYAIVCARVANGIVRGLSASRTWEVSLQLHMGLTHDPDGARKLGALLRRMVPTVFVKVPFTPHAPHCLLVARDLERRAIRVNFTSTFSARQALVAGLLAGVERTNVFMGRLNQGLGATLLGEHVCLEAQRALRAARERKRIPTQLIVASVRSWRNLVDTAGCDVVTAPCDALQGLLEQEEVGPEDLRSRLEDAYEDRLEIGDAAERRLGRDAVARLWRIEPELVEFLDGYRESEEFRTLQDGDALARRFEAAGFGDLFQAPDDVTWKEIRRGKLPDLASDVPGRFALDTLYTLHAHGDFERHQEQMDAEIARRAGLRG